MWLKVVLVFMAILKVSSSAKIFAIVATPSHSHQIAFFELWRELSSRGHQITLATTDSLSDPSLINIRQIDLSPAYIHLAIVTNVFLTQTNPWKYHDAVRILLKGAMEYALSHPQVQEMSKGKEKFDVVLVEHLIPEMLIFGRIYKCPTVVISSTDVDQIYYQVAGNPTHPVSHPHFYLPYFGSLSFQERLLSTLYYLYSWYHFKFVQVQYYEDNLRKYFNISTSFEELLDNTDLFIFNSHPVIHEHRALGPTTILMNYQRGTLTSRKISERINKDLKDFMDKAKGGFIYFSLGSNVKIKELPKEILETILKVLKELPYPVLYKCEESDLPGKPDNVKIINWAPQKLILNHPNIKLFITQGGRQSTEEAVYAAVPMVVIPFFYDQDHNGHILKERGVAQVIQKPLEKDALLNTIKEVSSDPRYKIAAKRLKKLALDVPIDGLKQAVWWIEYAIRNNGTKQLRNPLADLPLYQFFLLDVIGFLVFFLVVIISFIYFIGKIVSEKFKPYKPYRKIDKKLE